MQSGGTTSSQVEAAFYRQRFLMPIKYMRKLGRSLCGRFFDRRLGIKTEGVHDDGFLQNYFAHQQTAWPERADKTENGDGTYSVSIGYHNMLYGRRALGKVTNDDVFIDIGCGTGRALFYFGQFKFRRLIGLEYESQSVEYLKQNHEATKVKNEFTCTQGDASKYEFTDETVVFMFNPFGADTMNAMLDRLKESLERNPRRIRVLYFRPSQHEVLAARDWIKPIRKSLPLPFVLVPFRVYEASIDS